MSVSDPESYTPEFFSRAARALDAWHARNITIAANRISFTGGIFRLVTNLNPLVPISSGHIEITQTDDEFVVFYEISFAEMLVIDSVMFLLFAGYILFSPNAPAMPVGALVIFSVLGWLFLFGLNWLLGVVQFSSLVKSMVRGGERIEQIVGRERR
ncbi:MAG TPA: hypothetical protein VJT50_16090 [Pyrinomonadaceae bacterium]|nr:hypothetical protein [Pyrinomonadaceae bacterium]